MPKNPARIRINAAVKVIPTANPLGLAVCPLASYFAIGWPPVPRTLVLRMNRTIGVGHHPQWVNCPLAAAVRFVPGAQLARAYQLIWDELLDGGLRFHPGGDEDHRVRVACRRCTGRVPFGRTRTPAVPRLRKVALLAVSICLWSRNGYRRDECALPVFRVEDDSGPWYRRSRSETWAR